MIIILTHIYIYISVHICTSYIPLVYPVRTMPQPLPHLRQGPLAPGHQQHRQQLTDAGAQGVAHQHLASPRWWHSGTVAPRMYIYIYNMHIYIYYTYICITYIYNISTMICSWANQLSLHVVQCGTPKLWKLVGINPKNHSCWSYVHQLSYLGVATLYIYIY